MRRLTFFVCRKSRGNKKEMNFVVIIENKTMLFALSLKIYGWQGIL